MSVLGLFLHVAYMFGKAWSLEACEVLDGISMFAFFVHVGYLCRQGPKCQSWISIQEIGNPEINVALNAVQRHDLFRVFMEATTAGG